MNWNKREFPSGIETQEFKLSDSKQLSPKKAGEAGEAGGERVNATKRQMEEMPPNLNAREPEKIETGNCLQRDSRTSLFEEERNSSIGFAPPQLKNALFLHPKIRGGES